MYPHHKVARPVPFRFDKAAVMAGMSASLRHGAIGQGRHDLPATNAAKSTSRLNGSALPDD